MKLQHVLLCAAVLLLAPLGCSTESDAPCEGDACASVCTASTTSCSRACVDLGSDARHCGACGASCGDGQRCIAGACACGDGQTACTTGNRTACVDLSTSATSCGACGRACSTAETCIAGTCSCIGEAIVCGGACVDPSRDSQHCGATAGCGESKKGAAGAICKNGDSCVSGACTPCVSFALAKFAFGSTGTRALATADLDGDGHADLLALGIESLDVFKGHGDGAFTEVQRLVVDSSSLSDDIVVADLDGDGHLDLAVSGLLEADAPTAHGVVFVFYGYPDGTFAPTPKLVARVPNRFVGIIVATDLDGDGKRDLLVTDPSFPDNGIAIARATGPRTYSGFTTMTTGPGRAAGLALGDLDGNGKLDLVVANDGKEDSNFNDFSTIDVLMRTGPTTFGPRRSYDGGVRSSGIALADLDGDKKLDIVTADGPSLSLLFGKGDGTFSPATHLLTQLNSAHVLGMDMNGDGIVDLVVSGGRGYAANPGSPASKVEVRIGLGDGTFHAAQLYDGGSGSVAVADVNGDGKPDILAGDYVTGQVAVYLSGKRASCP